MFESPSPRPRGVTRWGASDGLLIRRAVHGDLDSIAAMSAERHGEEVGRWRRGIEAFFREAESEGSGVLYVATLRDEVIGHGKASYFVPPGDVPENCNPEGWHLSGVLIRPGFRRRGVGSAMTRIRLDWVSERADSVFYFASALNTVSIDLHRALGFEEVRRRIWHPGVSFTGGVGVLFRCDLQQHKSRVQTSGGQEA